MTFENGQKLFEERRFQEAKDALTSALTGASEQEQKKIKMWIRKCDTHLNESGVATNVEAVKAPEPAPAPTPAPAPAAAPTATAEVVKAPAELPAAKPRPPVVRHEWFQSPNNLTFSFFAKGRKAEDVKVDATSKSMEVTIALDEGKEFQISFDPFFGDIVPSSIKTDVRSVKIEITVNKATSAQWPVLEGTAETAILAPAAQGQAALPSAYSKPKKFVISDEDIKDVDGMDGTTKFFKEIFATGSDEQRKAMMKSFQESGGTVLSTNWEDVGKREVKVEAPTGMEPRKWEH